MSENLEIYDKCREVPKEALKEITAGRLKGKSDINPMWRIKKLTELFGMVGFGWYYEITKQWIEEGSDNIKSAFVNINLFIKINDEWSKPIQGNGGSTFIAKESAGLYTSDECFKMALTDAISVSCKAIGIGADVYWSLDKTKNDINNNQKTPVQIANNSLKIDKKEDVNQDDLLIAIQEASESKTTEQLNLVWKNWKIFQQNEKFKQKVKEMNHKILEPLK